MTLSRKHHVLVLMGGPSSEHEVSLETGKNIAEALDRKNFRVSSAVLPKDEKKFADTIWTILEEHKPSVIFIAMHGEYGEDGKIQALFETLHIPYTGSGSYASALAMDKHVSALLFGSAGLTVPRYITFRKGEMPVTEMVRSARAHFDFPFVVKPVDRGSSVGVSLVRKKEEIRRACELALTYSDRVMVQEYIQGREVTCGVLENPSSGRPRALVPTEILPQIGDFYSYDAKYSEGGTLKKTPPELPKRIIDEIQTVALGAHQALGCAGMSRTDMLIKGEKIYVLEVNTIPGMTSESLLPRGAKAMGMSFPKLLTHIVESALRKFNNKK